MTDENKRKLEFKVQEWDGSLENFRKQIKYTIDVRIDGKRKAIIYIPIDGSKPQMMEYEREGFVPGIHSGVVDGIAEKYGLAEKVQELYPRLAQQARTPIGNLIIR